MPGGAASGPLVRTEVQALTRAHWGTPLSVGDQADEGLIAEIYAGLNAELLLGGLSVAFFCGDERYATALDIDCRYLEQESLTEHPCVAYVRFRHFARSL